MATTNQEVAAHPNSGFVKGLGLTDATTLVMGSMIGSGIFIVSSDVARQVRSPGLLMLCWVMSAALTVIAALSYGELAAAMPHAGGQYVYLRESFGRLWGFLYGWTLFLVIQTGTIAAVAVAFAKFAGVFFPSISASRYLIGAGKAGLTTQQLLAIACIVSLSLINTRGIRTGAVVQNVFTFAKVASLLGLVILGLLLGRNAHAMAVNFHDFWRNAGWNWGAVALVGTAMVGPLFSSDAWNNVTFTAGEVRNPKRNLPI
jgi:APA family basic amino acid/polyamine antiporter